MKIEFQIRGVTDDDDLRRTVKTDLESLAGLVEVTAALVALECQPDVTPAYQAVAMLAVSGPDIQAGARDHAWRDAWRKVVGRLREQIEERRSRQKAHGVSQSFAHSPAGNRGKH